MRIFDLFNPAAISPVWNDSGTTFYGVKVNVTDTASASASLLLDLQVGGVSKLNVSKSGKLSNVGADVNTSNLRVEAASIVYWNGRSVLGSPANGVLRLSNTAITDFDRLQFGGTTSAFPALKRSAATIVVRLADDSADAPLKASKLNLSALPTADPAVAGDLWNSAGTVKISAG